MSKNLIPEICKMLGVELGEEFKVNLNGWEKIYRFNNNGLFGEIQTEKWITCPELFGLLVTGNAKIIKLPWQPKKGDVYYTFELLGDKWGVRSSWCGGWVVEWQ